ncbi:MAG: hypothetical protein KF726_02505 [Anaerolineae bacterium]|nr:hypothetical protein [Anaerolineae bacterium]
MPYTVRLLTRWQATDTGNQIEAALLHPRSGVAYSDVTRQLDSNIVPAPNALVAEVYPVDDSLLAALDADPNLIVLWSEPDVETPK